MKKYFNKKEQDLENDFFVLKEKLARRRKLCKNKLLRNLDENLKDVSINEVLFLLHKIGDFCYEELQEEGIWDTETTKHIKQSCWVLLNKLYGYNSKEKSL